MKLFYNKWEKWSTIIIIFILLFIGLSGCSHQMIPFETKMEYGTTDIDSKNDKLSEKRSITQTWRWDRK
jgi:uncharacterized protein YceK